MQEITIKDLLFYSVTSFHPTNPDIYFIKYVTEAIRQTRANQQGH